MHKLYRVIYVLMTATLIPLDLTGQAETSAEVSDKELISDVGGRQRDGGVQRGNIRQARQENRQARQEARQQRFQNRVNRTPSMSRTDERRQARQQRDLFKPRGAVDRPLRNREHFKARFAQRRERQRQRVQLRKNNRENIRQRRRENRLKRQRVRDYVRKRYSGFNRWFDDDFFTRRNYRPYYYNHGAYWWRRPYWNNVAVWVGGGWPAPIYYQSGYPIVLTQEDMRDDYADESDDALYAAPTPIESQGDWLPLGVFAVGQTADQAAYSSMFLQLAINKDGDIAGTYYNATTDRAEVIEGSMDRDTQEVIWELDNNPDSPTMITGLYNLTQDVVDVLVQFPNGTEQNWVLVRLNP